MMSIGGVFQKSRRMRSLFTAGIVAALTIVPRAGAQAMTQASAPPTRADLAWRYLLMDGAYSAADSVGTLADSTRATLNRIFDRSTLSFFGGRFGTTAAMMDTAITLASPSYRFERRTLPTKVTIGGKPARDTRTALLTRIAKLDSAGPLAQAIASAKARAALLVDSISPERSAEFLSKPELLARAVNTEVAALEKGRNPYVRLVGDLWRSYRGANGALVPVRVIAPTVAQTRAVGVLIALHGAGGDENMFADAYGRGIAARLARENGLLFVSPATTPFMTSAVQFDSLMAVLGREYELDATRVYVMGHSMGAGAAARLAQERPQAIAAVACLAGGSPITAVNAPPVLFIGAQLDPIIPASRVKAAAEATPTGTYEERANEGHTLMVRGGVLRAVPWMLRATRRSDFRPGVTGSVVPWTHTNFDTSANRFTFAVVSDLNGGERPGVFEVAAAQLTLLRPELVMSVGDLIDGPSPNAAALEKEWDDFDRRARLMPAPFFRVGGNHDLTGAELRTVWRSRYGPTWYSFVYKNALFLVLDTEDLTPERAQQIFVARTRAIQADRNGIAHTDTMEYYRMPERVAGNIGEEQAAFVTRALAEHPEVRWTFLFFHKPVWQSTNSPGFRAIEAALAARPYTVFSGHVHSFARVERNGREYYTLGTTGGGQNAKDPMSFDHLTLVTMTDRGPSISHLRMDGVLAPNGKLPSGGDSLCLQASKCQAPGKR